MKDKIKLVAEILFWRLRGSQVPPPNHIKQGSLKAFAREYGLSVFVETGTHSGATVASLKDSFDQVYSIELSDQLHASADHWFRNDDSVKIIHGDSGVELGKIIPQINKPTLFWLDAHYSAGKTARGPKDTPIIEELEHIFNANDFGHVILIDDARLFGVDPAYPNLADVRKLVSLKRPDALVSVKYDAIRIEPK